ncbi:hypothetical protein SAMD00023520_00974 [Listeria monocytogenes]|nr:hypothetical protein SAMD00023518_00064 [Listeria monocytogenes]GAT38174.1 hypothetical protein SAMD00023519_00336 [Listeria monocytogenes]GAT41022.1 hypothetical protein SAMD00023520_00974 [Listeria monocytogenes]
MLFWQAVIFCWCSSWFAWIFLCHFCFSSSCRSAK